MVNASWEGPYPTRSDLINRGYELVYLEQGKGVALYEHWPNLFTVALGGRDYPASVNIMLCDLHNAVANALWEAKHKH